MKTIYKLTILILLIASSNETLYSQYSLWTWGSNNNGQLGNDRPEDAPLPVIVNEDGDWEKVYSYYAIKKDGSLWTWGNNNINPINEGQESGIRLFDDSKWEKIFTSKNTYSQRTTYGIKQDGSLWSWGYWHFGWVILEDSTLKNPNGEVIKEPILIDSTHNWKEVEVTQMYLSAIDDDGYLYTWGRYWKYMGIGEHEDLNNEVIDIITKVGTENNWLNISIANYGVTFAFKEDGSLWFWGHDNDKLIDTVQKNYYSPVKIGNFDCVDVRSNNMGTLFTNSKGEILSIGNFNNVTTTKPNQLTYRIDYIEFVETDEGSFAFQLYNNCLFIGANDGLKFGEHYKDSFYSNFVASQYKSLKGCKDIAQVRNGFIFIDSLNNLRAWGNNTNGELGNGITSYYEEPFRLLPNKYFKDISGGANYTLALDEYGMLWGWGNNIYNQLEVENSTFVNSPIPVTYEHDWKNIFTYDENNFAIKEDGSLWSWGREPSKLGLGEISENVVSKPTQLIDKGPWKEVVSSRTHTIGLKENGSIWVWGEGGLAMGIDGISASLLPIQVGDSYDWDQIACGEYFSVALKNDGTIWGWGVNGGGVLGDYHTKQYELPTKLENNVGKVINLSASDRSVHFFLSDGKYKLWNNIACGITHGEYEGFRSLTIRQYQNSSFIDKNGKLYLWNESGHFVGPRDESGFKPNDWIKVTGGRQHYIGLRGEYITNVRKPRKLVNADIYPNPSVSNINIDFDSFHSNISISIFDVYGKLVLEDKSQNTDRISINHDLPTGAYILQCRDGNS